MVLVVKSTLKPASFDGIDSEVDFEADYLASTHIPLTLETAGAG